MTAQICVQISMVSGGFPPSAHAHVKERHRHSVTYNYMQCTQLDKQLSTLALIHINYKYDINIAHICKLFSKNIQEKMKILFFPH